MNLQTNQIEYGDIKYEVRHCVSNIHTILEAAGCTFRDVVRVGFFSTILPIFPQ
ncbi:MAG: Rid family hydrolase [Candidatus Acidiferrales bacterium]